VTRARAIAWVVAALCGAVAIGIYAPVLDFPFVAYDDDVRLLTNRPIRAGFTWWNVRWAFSSEWDGTWSPLTWISHMLDFSLYGSDAGGHHRTNLLLHGVNVMLLFGALRSATGDTLRPAAVALLLAVHPIHVESVAWVSERKGLLSATFALASLWCYVAQARSGGRRIRRLCLLFLALSLMAKPMPVTLPLLFLLLDYWPLSRMRGPGNPSGRRLRELVLEKWPYLLVAIGFGVVALLAQREVGITREMASLTLPARIANALFTGVLYPWKLVWPEHLASFYPHPSLPGGTPLGALPVLLSLGAIALLALGAWRARQPAPRLGLSWYAISVLPALGIVQVGSQAMADRYAYLPAIGIYIAVVWGVAAALPERLRPLRAAAGLVFCVALVLLAVACRQQIDVWSSSERLFRHATQTTDANYWMHFKLADTLVDRGRIEEAIAHYRTAVEIHPGLANAHFHLANLLAAEGQIDAAIGHYRLALDTLPRFGGARDALGRLLIAKGDLPNAMAHYQQEARPRPDPVEAWTTLADLLFRAGNTAAAAQALDTARALLPEGAASPPEIEALREQLRMGRLEN
jgi:tetratricopeptide (TPR) repeat protein